MKRIIFLSLIIPFLFIHPMQVTGQTQTEVKTNHVEAKQLDSRAKILKDYLSQFNSPLENYSQDLVDAADTYKLDWKLVPAIAGVESTFGKQTPGGYNGWGWGVYGTQAIYFKSWRDGIFIVAEGLREKYLNKGLDNPYSMNRIYAASPYWGGHVDYFLNDLNNFAKNYPTQVDTQNLLDPYGINNNVKTQDAGPSAKLTYKI
ncbi:hypothetical protein HY025_03760 [Candidatus Daviesbacteria bacterium]|nr:hypothetical protein [Candidatus Daviesbacteria bacterium]